MEENHNTGVGGYNLDRGQTLTIHDPDTTGFRVNTPLPETFGFQVGSEIGTPFSGYQTDSLLAKGLALAGTSVKTGLVTKKMYMGPEPTEISMTLNFNAWNSARDEVLVPVLKLMFMSVGSSNKVSDLVHEFSRQYEQMDVINPERMLAKKAGAENVQGISDLVRYMRSPGMVNIRFGDIYKLRNVYLSSVEPEFSNVLDVEKLPMQATVSIQAQLSEPFDKEQLNRSFYERVNTSEQNGGV